MKNYFKFLYKHAIAFLMLLIVCFLSSVVVIDLINTNKSYYEATFVVENIETFDSSLLNDVEYLNSIKNSASKYENIDVEKMLDRNHFNYTINNNSANKCDSHIIFLFCFIVLRNIKIMYEFIVK